MYFIVPDICNQILVTLQWFKYSANPNGSTLYTEKSHPSILKSHKQVFIANLWSNQICRGVPFPYNFVEEVVPLLGEMTDKLVLTFVCGRN